MAGELIFPEVAAPANPGTGGGKGFIYLGTDGRWRTINDTPATAVLVGQDTVDALTNKTLILPAGTTALAPIQWTSGTNKTNVAAGDNEFDGVAFYTSADTTNGRRFNDNWHYFRLTANGTGITTIADFFGTNDGIPTVLNGVYDIEWYCYLTSSGTAATATWTIVNTQTVTNMVAEWTGNVITGIAATGAASMAGVITQTAATVALPVTGTLSNASHIYVVHALIEAATAGNVRLRLTMGASGTGTPLRDSFFRVRRLPAGNAGTFVA